jgi:hypothetical protein
MFAVWFFCDDDWEMLDCDPIPADVIPVLLLSVQVPLLFLPVGVLPP